MRTLEIHKTAKDFLDKNLSFLEQRELENNLLLGVSLGIPNKTEENEKLVFLSNKDNEGNFVCSLKTISKALIGGNSLNEKCIKEIADFYFNNNIELTGIVGEEDIVRKFLSYYPKEAEESKELIVHKLEKVNEIKLSEGIFKMCDVNDLNLLTDWLYQFQFDTNNHPKKDKSEILNQTEYIVKKNNFYKWVLRDETKSIACIIRTTNNFGIVGGVYTPKEERGKGYASSLVFELSKHILKNKKFCGLYTDKSNPTSNKIYQNIGYFPLGISVDIKYKEKKNKMTAGNSGLAKGGLRSFEETFVLGSTVVLRMNISAEFPATSPSCRNVVCKSLRTLTKNKTIN